MVCAGEVLERQAPHFSLPGCGPAGTLATFVGWTQQSLAKAEAAGQPGPDQEVPRDVVPGTVNAHPYQVGSLTEHEHKVQRSGIAAKTRSAVLLASISASTCL
jgi:hypothetical protein